MKRVTVRAKADKEKLRRRALVKLLGRRQARRASLKAYALKAQRKGKEVQREIP